MGGQEVIRKAYLSFLLRWGKFWKIYDDYNDSQWKSSIQKASVLIFSDWYKGNNSLCSLITCWFFCVLIIYDFRCFKVCTCAEQNTVGIHTLIKCAMLQINYNLKKIHYKQGDVLTTLVDKISLTLLTSHVMGVCHLSLTFKSVTWFYSKPVQEV